MLRELRRFNVTDGEGRLLEVVEVATFLDRDGCEHMDGVPTMMTMGGAQVYPTKTLGVYRIPRSGLTMTEAAD